MTKRGIIRLIAILVAVSMPMLTMLSVTADAEQSAFSTETKYVSPDVNELSGLGKEPEDISVTAGAEYLEKVWYEYVVYSDKAVASYRIDDGTRLLFYDPYTYTNSLVMEVNFDATTTEFDTMSSYTISKTNTKTMSSCVTSTDTTTSAVQTSGRDITYSYVENGGTVETNYNHGVDFATSGKVETEKGWTYKPQEYETTSFMWNLCEGIDTEIRWGKDFGAGAEIITIGSTQEWTTNKEIEWLTDKETETTTYSPDYKTTTTYTGNSTVEDKTTSETEGWVELSARVTKTLGSARATSTSWSEEESTTVTKTYAATHFASDGVTPLPWAIVHYEVLMPMKCVMQIKHSGEWVTVSAVYALMTTVKGTCRAWMQNGQVYYEDWGSGEPVVASDFWGQFMTREQLMAAYSNKLYPVGGVD